MSLCLDNMRQVSGQPVVVGQHYIMVSNIVVRPPDGAAYSPEGQEPPGLLLSGGYVIMDVVGLPNPDTIQKIVTWYKEADSLTLKVGGSAFFRPSAKACVRLGPFNPTGDKIDVELLESLASTIQLAELEGESALFSSRLYLTELGQWDELQQDPSVDAVRFGWGTQRRLDYTQQIKVIITAHLGEVTRDSDGRITRFWPLIPLPTATGDALMRSMNVHTAASVRPSPPKLSTTRPRF